MPPPTAHETWLIDFAAALTYARPDIGNKFARLIAVRAWVRDKHRPAREAAEEWLAANK